MTFPLLVLLIAVIPLTTAAEGPIALGLTNFIAALGVIGSARSMSLRSGEAAHLARVISPAVLVAVIPAIFMIIQVTPLEWAGLAHPIWESARVALGKPILGTISIDPGLTLAALIRYSAVCALVLFAAWETIERRRADWVLGGLAGATAFIALLRIGEDLVQPTWLDAAFRATATAGAGVGLVLAAAAFVRKFESFEARRAQSVAPQRALIGMGATLAAGIICVVALHAGAAWQQLLPPVGGLAVFASIVLARRLRLGWLIATALAGVLIAAAIALAVRRDLASSGIALALAAEPDPAQIDLAARMLADSRWLGSGAGTFTSLAPMFRALGEAGGPTTTAALMSVELGPPMLWIMVSGVTILVANFVRRALRRGRDSSYPAGAAGVLTTLTVGAFIDATLFSTPIVLIAGIVLGLGLAQSLGRNVDLG